jgi:hypothetical protein
LAKRREFAEIVADVVSGCLLRLAADAGADSRFLPVSFEKIRRMLPAFKP